MHKRKVLAMALTLAVIGLTSCVSASPGTANFPIQTNGCTFDAYEDQVKFVATPGMATFLILDGIFAADKWNETGSDGPRLNYGANAPNTPFIQMYGFYDFNHQEIVGQVQDREPDSSGQVCVYGHPPTGVFFYLNTAALTSSDPPGNIQMVAGHEIGHSLGLAHQTFHENDNSWWVPNIATDCPLLALMFWHDMAWYRCGINKPTQKDIDAVNRNYV